MSERPRLRREMQAIAARVWGGFLGVRGRPVAAPPRRRELDDRRLLGARVAIGGAFSGDVVVLCPETLARRAVAHVFGIPEDEASPEDIQDVLGEIANMVAGGLKRVLPSPCELTTPAIARDPAPRDATVSTIEVLVDSEGQIAHLLLQADPNHTWSRPSPRTHPR